MDLQQFESRLQQAGVVFGPGLTPEEAHRIETQYGFRFPPDYRAFLMHALPISHDFFDWRNASEESVTDILSWPYRSMCFDIEHNSFWLRAWGSRPRELSLAFAVAKDALAQAPTLIPIFGHRYIPGTPAEPGNPVFSICQTDIIYYGRDLAEYLENEFAPHLFGYPRHQVTDPVKYIPFWSYLVDVNNGLVEDGRTPENHQDLRLTRRAG